MTGAVAAALEPRPQAVYVAASGGDPAARRIVKELARRGFRGTVMTTSAFAAPASSRRTVPAPTA